MVRRLWSHLTRSRARAAWALAVAGILLYAAYDPGWLAADAVRQFSLILASVAAGAVFLPELSSSLWTLKPDQIRDIIPTPRVAALQEALIRSQVDEPAWAERILDGALRPLLENVPSSAIVEDLRYSTKISPNDQALLGSARPMHRVTQELVGNRVLPLQAVAQGDVHYWWVSVAKDNDALQKEYDEPACLFREVVELDPSWDAERWRQEAMQHCKVSVFIDGYEVLRGAKPQPADAALPGVRDLAARQNNELLRAYFSTDDLKAALPVELRSRLLRGQRLEVAVRLSYRMDICHNHFFVLFGSYYAVGNHHVLIELVDEEDKLRLYSYVFFGRALGHKFFLDEAVEEGTRRVDIRTESNTMLWPGSGVCVWWERRTDPENESPAGAQEEELTHPEAASVT